MEEDNNVNDISEKELRRLINGITNSTMSSYLSGYWKSYWEAQVKEQMKLLYTLNAISALILLSNVYYFVKNRKS